MAMHEYFDVPTKFGTMAVTPTQADHIYIHNDPPGVQHEIVVNNTRMSRASAHLHLWKDGKWHIGYEAQPECERSRNMYAKKDLMNEASDSAKKKLAEEMTRVVNEWAAANPKAIFDAEINDLEQQKERAREAVQEAEENLRVKRDELNQVYGKLHAALHQPCKETDCSLCFPDTATVA